MATGVFTVKVIQLFDVAEGEHVPLTTQRNAQPFIAGVVGLIVNVAVVAPE